jgi:hypothetical protein
MAAISPSWHSLPQERPMAAIARMARSYIHPAQRVK